MRTLHAICSRVETEPGRYPGAPLTRIELNGLDPEPGLVVICLLSSLAGNGVCSDQCHSAAITKYHSASRIAEITPSE
jgi:hypothetical protein